MFASPGLVANKPRIQSIKTASGFTTILDVSASPLHETLTGGKSWGLWLDGPMLPFRTSAGISVFLCGAHSTYRYAVASNVWDAANISISPAGAVRNSANTGVQQDYDHRAWIFGVYADGTDVYAIAHHEWYNQRYTVDGKPGFNVIHGHEWITSPLWMKSNNNAAAASWSTKSYTSYTVTGTPNPARLFMTPEAYGLQAYDTMHGWQHPAGIVYPPDMGQSDDPYYYAFVDANNLVGPGDALLDVGFSLIRVSDINDPTTMQFYNSSGGWTARNMAQWQGSNGVQQPYVFFKVQNFDPYTQFARTDRMAQSIRWHTPTQQWLVFGYDGRRVPSLCMLRTKRLDNPQFEQNGVMPITYDGGGANSDYVGNSYITVFDPASTDQNFMDIGNSPLLVVTDNYVILKKQTLQINVS